MSDREFDEFVNKCEAVVYPIIFALFGLWCAYEVLTEAL